MKMKSLFALASVVVAMTACSNDEEFFVNDNFPADGVMRFTSSMKDVQTRAFGYDDGNVTGKDLDLWVTPTENPKEGYTYKGYILHHTTEAGWGTYSDLDSYGSYTPATLLWQDKTTPVEVVASNFRYRLVDLSTDLSISVFAFQTVDDNIKYSDYLYFKGTVNPTLTQDKPVEGGGIAEYALVDGKIRLPMRHIFSKVTISLTLGTEFSATGGLGRQTASPLTDVKVNGVYKDVRFNRQTGVFGEFKDDFGNAATPGSVTLANVQGDTAPVNSWVPATDATGKASATYNCILIPQTVATGEFSVSFQLGDKTYKWTSDNAVTLESGYAYTLELTAGKEIVTVKSISATAWNEQTEGSIATE